MGSCKEESSEYVCSEAFKLMSIGGIAQSFGDYIIKDHHRLAAEESRVKFKDIHLPDFLFRLAVFVDAQPLSAYGNMFISVDSSGQLAHSLAKGLVTYLVLLSGGCRYGRKHDVGT